VPAFEQTVLPPTSSSATSIEKRHRLHGFHGSFRLPSTTRKPIRVIGEIRGYSPSVKSVPLQPRMPRIEESHGLHGFHGSFLLAYPRPGSHPCNR
jgi:hypothetical protein